LLERISVSEVTRPCVPSVSSMQETYDEETYKHRGHRLKPDIKHEGGAFIIAEIIKAVVLLKFGKVVAQYFSRHSVVLICC